MERPTELSVLRVESMSLHPSALGDWSQGLLIHHHSPGRLTKMPRANESPRWALTWAGTRVRGVRWSQMSVGVTVRGDQAVTVRESILAETGARGRCAES